ncbi:uncharacterized protein LOC133203390 [Saccostrea echinata]|uniref:uncharacterized protein LOC133203390 n=1 Tax=Saccostrea echinata TaxID=191078 RepID=UPI002A809A9D|nr:uncharacterized protein LOC133203390 [Saccostrea echinata]
MSNRVIFPFLIMMIFTREWVICDNRFCEMWKETVNIVRICPSNKTEIENKNRNCQKYAEKAQLNNCTDYTKIRYHCVLNSYGNQTLEVCSPEKQINGFCAEFNEEVGEILPNHYLDCSLFTPPCSSHYNSADAYLYKNCYNHTNNELVIKRMKYGDVTTQMQPMNVSPGLRPSSSYLPSSSKIIEP